MFPNRWSHEAIIDKGTPFILVTQVVFVELYREKIQGGDKCV
jgi:hypothetical protein